MSLPKDNNTSLASKSDISGPSEEQRKMLNELVEMMGVKELSARTDRLEQSFTFLEAKIAEVVESQNKIITHLTSQATPGQTIPAQPQADAIQKIEALGKLAEALSPLADKWLNRNTSSPSILDQAYINEKIAKSAMGSFEIGEALTDVIKQKITGKAVQNVVKGIVSHEPA